MKQAFKTTMRLYQPEVVIHLGDLLDQGFFETDDAFKDDLKIVNDVFNFDANTIFKIIPGNHDIGFHHRWVVDIF